MNYIKLFESFACENKKIALFKSMINYDAIADLKELCIDDLDKDYTLTIGLILAGPNLSYYQPGQYMGQIKINHAREEENLSNLYLYTMKELKRYEKGEIIYNIYISNGNVKKYDDILDSIKSMYPDLKFILNYQCWVVFR